MLDRRERASGSAEHVRDALLGFLALQQLEKLGTLDVQHPLLAEVGVQFCKIAILHITANDGPIHPQPFAYIALRVQVHPYPYPAYDRAVWGIVARRCASEKGVQPQNLYFGSAGSGSGTWTARLIVAASSWARNASSMR